MRLWHWVNAPRHHGAVRNRLFHRLAAALGAGRACQLPDGLHPLRAFRGRAGAADRVLPTRVYWAFVGNGAYARQLFYLPVWNKTWLWGVFYELRWYLFMVKDPKKYIIGHNPLAHVAMFTFMLFLPP